MFLIQADEFLGQLTKRGFGPYTGVPCSYLKPFINYVIDKPDLEYWAANNEGEAIGIAAGAYLAGKKPVVMFQNSGMGNTVNPVTSLLHTFQIPLLLITTWRGEPGRKDEPQHELMGQITGKLLDVMRVERAYFPNKSDEVPAGIEQACSYIDNTSLPYAMIMRDGDVAPYELQGGAPQKLIKGNIISTEGIGAKLQRLNAIEAISSRIPEHAALIATTGKAGRELFYCNERAGNLYVVGSMGCASSIGLGITLVDPERPVVILDGDGAALMRLEAMVSVGHYRPKNLLHVILDNNMHDSTGGQQTQSGSVDFVDIAAACGYATATRVSSQSGLEDNIVRCLEDEGPHLVHVLIRPGSNPGLGRPTLTPLQVKKRFMDFLSHN